MKRNGSALLIVLGMMGFMVVSAVAFSAFMRSARLPSSYLRRSSASRHLIKAALAHAIDSIDRAIVDNPHPGVGGKDILGGNNTSNNRNMWPGRVLLATNNVNDTESTVSVLTLEGLAYIPPALVNEVRHYSRRTSTASWHPFGFDSGRYAFCAVDVSDYFDVNRMAADRARSSASNARLSLAYLFEQGKEHTGADSGAESWDTFMEKFRKVDNATLAFTYDSLVPLVSVADLNLALGESGQGGMYSPFCKYINSSGGDGFYNAGGDDEYDRIGRMTFVTDSWFPSSNAKDEDESDYDEIYDLTNPRYQPFSSALLGGAGGPRSVNSTSIGDIMASGEPTKVRLLDSMPVVALVALYDYLDKNSVPVSLACPTLERTPMICALKPNLNSQFVLKLEDALAQKVTDANGNVLDPMVKTTQTRPAYATYEYYIDPNFMTGLASLTLETLLVYPFPHEDAVKDTNFSVDGRATLFFSVDGNPVKMRTGNSGDGEQLHAKDKNLTNLKGMSAANGTITVPFTAQSKNFKLTNGAREEDAVFDMALRGTTIAGSEARKAPFARIRYTWQQVWDAENERYTNQTKPDNAEIDQAHCGVPPLAKNGEPDPDFVNDASFLNKIKNGGESVTLCMSVIARVTDNNQKTVDLVPAHIRDDKTFNNIDNNSGFPHATQVAGSAYPVMLFPTPVKVTMSGSGLKTAATTAQTAEPTVKAVRVDDPRYNYAPESWYDANGDVSKQTWIAQNGSKDRDGDIFMATSDQGYLQSIYELAFLPRLSNLVDGGGIMGGLRNPEDGRAGFGSQANAMNRDLMWHTYRAIPTKSDGSDDFVGLGFSSAGTGMKVNPYTDSTNIMMAAFANTPIDWRLASTNNSDEALEELSASQFNSKYAWNAYSSSAQFEWLDLEEIAGNFMENISPRERRNSAMNSGFTNWKKAWDNLGWRYDSSSSDTFCGVPLSGNTELWGIDREFLYGFWRDCFAVKQQLFLVFVRAEPFMMGGEGANQTPPQLGARAVALVWRDPTATGTPPASEGGKQGYPHRTRVLFYRQLD